MPTKKAKGAKPRTKLNRLSRAKKELPAGAMKKVKGGGDSGRWKIMSDTQTKIYEIQQD